MKKIIGLLAILIMGFCLTGCGKNSSEITSEAVIPPPAFVTIVSESIPEQVLYQTSRTFEAIVCDSSGQRLEGYALEWKVIGDIGAIDQAGNFRATTVGTGEISVSLGELTDKVTVEVYKIEVFHSTFIDVFDLVDSYFLYPERIPEKFDALSGQELDAALRADYGSIEGFLASLDDPYTRYYSPGEDPTRKYLDPDDYAGVGIYLEMMNGKLVVSYAMPGEPAAEAGLKTADIILEVDEESIAGLEMEEIISMIKGPEGTSVKLKIQRASDILEFEVVRGIIEVKSVYGEVIEGDIGYIKLVAFGSSASVDFDTVCESFTSEVSGLIIDLRKNGGGYLNAALTLASRFVSEDEVIMYYKEKDGIFRQVQASSGSKIKAPMVLLVDEYSASASEILTGVLKEYTLATVIGENTFGKGTMQIGGLIRGGSSLYITSAEFFTPNKNKIVGVGIAPDIEIPMSDEDFFNGNDPQLAAAITELKRVQGSSILSVLARTMIFSTDRPFLKFDDFLDPINHKWRVN